MTKHEFEVAMTCEGCSGAVTRILNKLGDVKFEIDLPKKLVWIESDKDVEVLMTALQKSGKEIDVYDRHKQPVSLRLRAFTELTAEEIIAAAAK